MVSVFCNNQGLIVAYYLEEGRTINKELRRLRQEMLEERREKLTRGVLLLQDNASAHTFQVAMAAATTCSFEVLPHSRIFQI